MPVTKLESSEARNTAALAISSTLPIRPIGILAAIWAMACFGSGAKIGVSIVPGLMTLARNHLPAPASDRRHVLAPLLKFSREVVRGVY
jgi:hypothetical protein